MTKGWGRMTNAPQWAYAFTEGRVLDLSPSEAADLEEIAKAVMHTMIQQSVYINGRFPHPPKVAQTAYEYALAMILERRALFAEPPKKEAKAG